MNTWSLQRLWLPWIQTRTSSSHKTGWSVCLRHHCDSGTCVTCITSYHREITSMTSFATPSCDNFPLLYHLLQAVASCYKWWHMNRFSDAYDPLSTVDSTSYQYPQICPTIKTKSLLITWYSTPSNTYWKVTKEKVCILRFFFNSLQSNRFKSYLCKWSVFIISYNIKVIFSFLVLNCNGSHFGWTLLKNYHLPVCLNSVHCNLCKWTSLVASNPEADSELSKGNSAVRVMETIGRVWYLFFSCAR